MKQKPTFIGLDLGGTKILMEGFDANLKLLIRVRKKTQTQSQTALMDQIYGLINTMASPKMKAIGIAVPGPVHFKKGTVLKTPHLPFQKNLPLKALLEKRYKVPVIVENDINAFLIAEHQRPALKKMKHVVAVMIGTGVGGSVMVNGEILQGKNGYAGELGHMVIDASSKLATFEQKTAGSFIEALAKSMGMGKMTTYELIKNTPESRKIKQALVQHMGTALANINLIFNPEAIVLGGSMYHLFLADRKDELRKIIAQHSMDGQSPKLTDGQKKTSVAKGVAMLAKKNSNN